MAFAALLTSDRALIGYAEVPDGTADGPVDSALTPSAPTGVATMKVFPYRPDLPADGSYFWDQAAGSAGSFLPQSRRTAKTPSMGDALMLEMLARHKNGERVPDWALVYIQGMTQY